MSLRVALFSLVASLIASAPNAAESAAKPDVTATVKSTLQARFPEAKITDVQPAPMPGLYEVDTADSIAYADATGEYLLSGSLMETRSKRNLTAERMDERNRIDFAKLPLDQAIKTVKGDGKRGLAVFSDPECPYCQQLEKELTTVTDVTIYTFMYPLAALHPEAPQRTSAIWCAADRAQAWRQWMLERKVPETAKCDSVIIEKNVKLAEELRVNSTPTLFAVNGRRVSGTIPTAQIEKLLEGR
jgi:Protein-disulfide isomerase